MTKISIGGENTVDSEKRLHQVGTRNGCPDIYVEVDDELVTSVFDSGVEIDKVPASQAVVQ